jgi:hypothetical protein
LGGLIGSGQVGSGRTLTATVIIELTQLDFNLNCQLELSLAIKEAFKTNIYTLFVFTKGGLVSFLFLRVKAPVGAAKVCK